MERVIAATQYGDLRGELSIDQAAGEELIVQLGRRVKLPAGFMPVGFRLSVIKGRMQLIVYAVDAEIAVNLTELRKHARNKKKIMVSSFVARIDQEDLAALLLSGVKRLDLVAQVNALDGKELWELGNE